MTLGEAIEHTEEVAKRQEEDATYYKVSRGDEKKSISCKQCAEEYRQLAEWLKDYKRLLEQENRFKRYTRQDDMHLVTIRQVKEVMKGEWL